MADRRLYLVAYLAPDVSRFIDASDALASARAAVRPVSSARRHLTVLDLAITGLPEALLVAALRLVMSVAPPRAFRVVLDSCVVRADRSLIVASEPITGFRRCQRELLAALRGYALDLPATDIAVRPHLTLGYDHARDCGVRGIDGVSWLVDTLTLIVSHHGDTRHEPIEQWRLPSQVIA